jgi:L-threonylcarbamoyladenylate synthase
VSAEPILRVADAAALARTLGSGGVAVFPADTVYGLACDPEDEAALARLHALKGRPSGKPSAVMLFRPELVVAELPLLGTATIAALRRLLPGPVTVLLPNRAHRFPLACGDDPDTIGVRVPALPAHLAALESVDRPLLQSSANLAGGPDARRLGDVPAAIRDGADLVLDGGELPGTPSTVVDLRRWEPDRRWEVLREGAISRARVELLLRGEAL